MLMPRDGEHDAAIAGVRHHDGAGSRQEGTVEDKMDTLAGRDHGFCRGICPLPQFIGEGTGGVHNHFAFGREGVPRFDILGDYSVDEVLFVLRQISDLHVIQKCGALLEGSGHHVDEEARIVELAVVIDYAATEPIGLDRGQ
jgi:hypothetical protein